MYIFHESKKKIRTCSFLHFTGLKEVNQYFNFYHSILFLFFNTDIHTFSHGQNVSTVATSAPTRPFDLVAARAPLKTHRLWIGPI